MNISKIIMKRTIVAVFFVVTSSPGLFAESFGMGNIISVYAESGLNSLRNPALIMAQPQNSSFEAALFYTPYKKTDNNVSTDLAPNVSIEETGFYSGGLFLSYSKKSGNFGFGIGLTSGGYDQVSYSTSKYTVSSNVDKTETFGVSPLLITSFSFRLDKGHFFGFQIGLGYSHEYSKKEKTAGEIFKGNSDIFSAEPAFGYLAKGEKSEAGIMLKPGKYILRRDRMDYEDTTPSNGTLKIPFYSRYDTALALTAGGYFKVKPEVGIAMEFEYRIPSTRNEKFFDDFNGFPPTTATSNIYSRNYLMLKTGADYKIRKNIIISGGAAYLNAIVDSDRNGKQHSEVDYYFITAGVDYIFENGARVSVTPNFSYMERKFKWDAQGATSFHMEIKSSVYNTGLMLAFSTSY